MDNTIKYNSMFRTRYKSPFVLLSGEQAASRNQVINLGLFVDISYGSSNDRDSGGEYLIK